MKAMIPKELLISAYASGWFPMAVEEGDIRWYSPDPRGIMPLDAFHVPARLARVIRRRAFTIEIDRDFRGVIRACAGAERRHEEGTWIDDEIVDSYSALHDEGLAHSVEAWQDGLLVGGVYGVAIGRAFFGESMFTRVPDASKVALVRLVGALTAWEFGVIDCQMKTEHLARFGAREIPRAEFVGIVGRLTGDEGPRRRWTLP